MSEVVKICHDMMLPWEMRNPRPMESMIMLGVDGKEKAIMPIAKRWPKGTVLSVRFIGGTPEEHQKVEEVASEWMKHCGIKFVFDNAPDAVVRVGFVQGDGSWSYLGTDNLEIPMHSRTMNFGWALDAGTILHEFGHLLGLAHEHSSPHGGMQWDEQRVIQDLSGPPNNWDVATIRHNVLKKYNVDHIHGTQFDRDSIMLYAFPSYWTLNGVGTHANDTLSTLDKEFIATMYPKSLVASDIVSLPVNRQLLTAATIKQAGEEDLFSFEVDEPGEFIIETVGDTDVIMKLFRGANGNDLIAEDDDSGEQTNARIEASLQDGKYVVQVRHYYESSGVGDYGISVTQV